MSKVKAKVNKINKVSNLIWGFRPIKRKRTGKVIIAAGALFLVTFGNSVVADVPMPVIPKAKGDKCVEETAFMRRNHMDLLKHQRDDTLRKGIRTKKHSLQGCLDCHAVYEDSTNKVAVTIKSDKHFCNSCHNYAAVKIDCFGCHNSKPFVKKSPHKIAPLQKSEI